jgi:predicted amidohydrolase YtcJ
VNLAGANSYGEVIARVKERAARASQGEWILGRGWDQNRWPSTVWLRRVDGHAGLANSAAMRPAGVSASTRDPEGGRIIRDANGNPSGVFVDAAEGLIDRAVPPPSFALRKQRVLAAAQRIAENGLTEMHDAGADPDTIRSVRELIDERRFPIRTYTMISDDPHALDHDSVGEAIRRWGARQPWRSAACTL